MEALPTTNTEIFKLPSSPSPSPRSPATFLCQNPTFPDSRRCLYSGVSLVSIAPSLMRSSSPPPTRAVERANQGNSDGSGLDKALHFPDVSNLTKPLLDFTLSNFLPIALISAVAIGMVNPALGCRAHKYSLSQFGTFGIFFISGLKLKGKDIAAVAEAWPAGVFGLASILSVGPFFARLILQVQLAPQEFVTGLALFSCMPTTLSSGVALTQLVGGNSALALTLTVTSNLLGIVTVPFWISKLVAGGYGVAIPIGQLFWSLLFTLLVPLVLGKDIDVLFHSLVARNIFQGLATYADQNTRVLSMTSIIFLSITPWMQVSKSRSLLLMVKPQVFIEAIGMGILLHLALLGFNVMAMQALSAGFDGKQSIFARKENARALLLVCSQKALLVVVAVVEQLSGALGQSGLLVLPCVATHINQVIIDSFLVNFFLRKDKAQKRIRKF